jgi:UDP-glucose 4-epimerase
MIGCPTSNPGIPKKFDDRSGMPGFRISWREDKPAGSRLAAKMAAPRVLPSYYNRVVASPHPINILVTGGAGYIGSHTAKVLLQRGYDVTVVDDLSRGYRHNVAPERLHVMSTADTDGLTRLMTEKQVTAVIHFAAHSMVGESMVKPELYFDNNVSGSLSLFTAMTRAGVRHLVFSSTAAVYGMPASSPIAEDFPLVPMNPYGESKLMVEKMLRWFDAIHNLRSICLRYFNAAGADPDGELGEEHDPESHLIPLVLRAVKTGKPVTVFGDDYPTPDGSCIRDYIHVMDLSEAHIVALESLIGGGPSDRFNVGTGVGHSVLEVIQAVEQVTGEKVPHAIGPRREGDPPALVAHSRKVQRTLGWKPRYTELRDIAATAWAFEKHHVGVK